MKKIGSFRNQHYTSTHSLARIHTHTHTHIIRIILPTMLWLYSYPSSMGTHTQSLKQMFNECYQHRCLLLTEGLTDKKQLWSGVEVPQKNFSQINYTEELPALSTEPAVDSNQWLSPSVGFWKTDRHWESRRTKKKREWRNLPCLWLFVSFKYLHCLFCFQAVRRVAIYYCGETIQTLSLS